MIINCFFVGLGGFIGSVFRYLIGMIPLNEDMLFPIKTLAINIIGAFIIGLIAAASAKGHAISPRFVLFLKVGICGGFTTFSTFALESLDLIKGGHAGIALVYVILSTVLGILAVFAGEMVV